MKIKQLLLASLMGLAMICAGISTNVLAMEATKEQAEEATEERPEQSFEEQVQQLAEAYNLEQEDEESKLICKKESVTGTRFKRMVCRTVKTKRLEHESAKRTLDQVRPAVQPKGG